MNRHVEYTAALILAETNHGSFHLLSAGARRHLIFKEPAYWLVVKVQPLPKHSSSLTHRFRLFRATKTLNALTTASSLYYGQYCPPA